MNLWEFNLQKVSSVLSESALTQLDIEKSLQKLKKKKNYIQVPDFRTKCKNQNLINLVCFHDFLMDVCWQFPNDL